MLKTLRVKRKRSSLFLVLKSDSKFWDKFLATENPLKVMKNAFYFTSRALFVLKIFKILSWLFGYVAKQID